MVFAIVGWEYPDVPIKGAQQDIIVVDGIEHKRWWIEIDTLEQLLELSLVCDTPFSINAYPPDAVLKNDCYGWISVFRKLPWREEYEKRM